MRTLWGKQGLFVVAAIICFSLAGCSGGLFAETTTWTGGTHYNEQDRTVQRPDGPMSLTLEPDGTGSAIGLPQGSQKESDNICIEVTSDERYDGKLEWRKVSDYRFEITFADSEYTITSGPGRFLANWEEVRIYTCEWGYDFWSMEITCAEPDLIAREVSSCS